MFLMQVAGAFAGSVRRVVPMFCMIAPLSRTKGGRGVCRHIGCPVVLTDRPSPAEFL